MNPDMLRNQIHTGIDRHCAALHADPHRVQRVLSAANKKENTVMKKKIPFGLAVAIVLLLIFAAALAISLDNYFGGFAALENTYGEYESWPASAKTELVDLMDKSGVLSVEESALWKDAANRNAAAEEVLAMHFTGMLFIDTYNAMTRELGPIEQWTDAQRALYTTILQKYNKQGTDWPRYMVPGEEDLTREEAVRQAKQAVLSMFSVSEESLDDLVIDAIFSVSESNTVGAPLDEPFWEVDFGYGYAYRIYMTRNGEMLGISGPQTAFYAWNIDIWEGTMEATPSSYDADIETALHNASDALTEIMNVPYESVAAMDAAAKFVYSDLYCFGDEPVWLISWSCQGEVKWNVLLGYDGSLIDVEPAGKLFDAVKRRSNDLSLDDMWKKRCSELGMTEDFFNTAGNYYYNWTLAEKAAFYETWRPIADAYEKSHPYFHGKGNAIWEWTRNASGLPDDKAISQDAAVSVALTAIEKRFGDRLSANDVYVFYCTTKPEKPEWRIATATRFVTISAYTGEIMTLEQLSTTDEGIRTIIDFLQQ